MFNKAGLSFNSILEILRNLACGVTGMTQDEKNSIAAVRVAYILWEDLQPTSLQLLCCLEFPFGFNGGVTEMLLSPSSVELLCLCTTLAALMILETSSPEYLKHM